MDTKQRERKPRTPRKAPPVKKRKSQPVKEEPVSQDVVYQPGEHFSRNRLILQLVTVVAVVIAVLLGISVFFKVENHAISGCNKYSAEQIWEAAGIRDGENLLTIGIPQASARIMEKLPYIASVRIGIKLPNTVYIEVVESKVVYAVQAEDQSWWLVNSEGKVVDRAPDGAQTSYTRLQGVQITGPEPGQGAVAHEIGSTQTDPDGNTLPMTITEAEKLQTALDIVQYLESNGIIGSAASVDVTDMGNLELWYGTQYRVKLGNDTQLLYKISVFKGFLEDPRTDPYEAGEVDCSFTTWPDQVGFTPFKDET
jgi:hypothetical protein